MKSLIFANGEIRMGVMVERILNDAEDARIIAADGGAHAALSSGYMPDVVIGDMDSIETHTLRELQADGAAILRYPVDKDETDLEIALKWAAGQGCDRIRIIGAIGGRTDQMLANIYLLALPELRDCDVMIISANESIRLLYPEEHIIRGTAGDTISLLPMGGAVSGIQTHNLKYPLKGETLYFGPARGISNEMLGGEARISFQNGALLVIHRCVNAGG